MVAILHPVGPGAQIPIDRAVVLIGRSPECDVVLDVSSKISRMHCAIVQVDADYFIRDLGSMNGVTVAGQKVEKDCKLTNGAEVLIGDVKFQFLANVVPAARSNKQAPVAGRPMPAIIDETAEVLDVEDVEMIPDNPRRSGMPSMSTRTPGKGTPRVPLDVDHVDVFEPEIIDADVIDAEVVDVDAIEIVEDIEDVEVIDDIELVDAVEVVDDVDVIDVELIEDVEIIDDDQPYRRPRRRK